MRPETFNLAAFAETVAQAAIGELMGIASNLDRSFLPVGEALLTLIEAVDAVEHGLGDVRAAFADGMADIAAADLTQASAWLVETPALQERRRGCLGELGASVSSLSGLSRDLDRVLHVLQFYSLNIKVAAAGAGEFVDFADEMNRQLGQGREELKAFGATVDQLVRQLASMSSVDQKLLAECRKLIPAVPDLLADAAAKLTGHQRQIIALVDTAEKVAQAIRSHIGQALGAIQISDSARQRIEHVAFACEMIADISDEASPEQREARGHIAALCVAQLGAIEQDFTAEARKLLGTLGDLLPDATRLLESIRQEQSIQSSHALIASLEGGIAESVALTSHLKQANADLDSILASVVATIEGLSARVERVRDLGIEVGYMSVNANLRCRRVPAISQPVAVIAREIKSHSRFIDALSDDFIAMAGSLASISDRISGMENAGGSDVSEMLSSSLASLSGIAVRTGKGLGKVTVDCDGIVARLSETTRNLRESIAVVERLRTVGSELSAITAPMIFDARDLSRHPLPAMLERLRAVYSMAQERAVHARFAPPGHLAAEPGHAEDMLGDDDALF